MKEEFGANFIFSLFNPKVVLLTLVIALVKFPGLKNLLSRGWVYPRLQRNFMTSMLGIDEMYYMFINVVIFSIFLSIINISVFCNKRRQEGKKVALIDGDVWRYLLKTLPIPIVVFAAAYGFLSSPMAKAVPVIGQSLMVAQEFGLIGILLAGFVFYFTFVGQHTRMC